MRIGFVYGSFSTGTRPFNFPRLYDDARGLTGSEISCVNFAKELAKLGHDVHLYATTTNTCEPYSWDGVNIHHLSHWPAQAGQFQVALSWNEPDHLRVASPRALRIVNQQLNDFSYCQPNFTDFVDVFTSPSQPHLEHMTKNYGNPDKWVVLPNGCDPEIYPNIEKVPGLVLYASSPDRGLHWLLQEWPEIKRRVPHARLRIFYNFDQWLRDVLPYGNSPNANLREASHRGHYVQETLKRLAPHGVEHYKSISRTQMAREMAQAQVLAYPCDTTTYTEGFSVTLMEACASRIAAVTTKIDSLGRIYDGKIPMIDVPVRDHIHEFTEHVVDALQNEEHRNLIVSRCVPFARQHSWGVLSQTLTSIISKALEKKQAA